MWYMDARGAADCYQCEPPVRPVPASGYGNCQEISHHFECARGYALFIVCFAVLQLAPGSGILLQWRLPPRFPAALLDILHEPDWTSTWHFCICLLWKVSFDVFWSPVDERPHSSLSILSSCAVKTNESRDGERCIKIGPGTITAKPFRIISYHILHSLMVPPSLWLADGWSAARSATVETEWNRWLNASEVVEAQNFDFCFRRGFNRINIHVQCHRELHIIHEASGLKFEMLQFCGCFMWSYPELSELCRKPLSPVPVHLLLQNFLEGWQRSHAFTAWLLVLEAPVLHNTFAQPRWNPISFGTLLLVSCFHDNLLLELHQGMRRMKQRFKLHQGMRRMKQRRRWRSIAGHDNPWGKRKS